ncbi:uncharacterized protein MKZ38_009982 [Zalerion maritima]|uniref:Chl4 n=1 Tax=Zalerion maritima TaxID=339359 RepID=A0AAD5WT81_9PEZI|nr:uncharacterized protein MKZ38_009982 [Zalerion maritima]
MGKLAVPGSGRLSSTLRINSSSSSVLATLNRLSRASLISLALDWLDERNADVSSPYIVNADDSDDEDLGDFYPPAGSLEQLRETYSDMKLQKGSKRDVIDRIVEGDWRRGLTLYQLAMADLQHMRDHPHSHKWAAYRICPLQTPTSQDEAFETAQVDSQAMELPRFHPSTFIRTLQAQSLPDVKAHFIIERPEKMPLLILRILVLESPYTNSAPSLDSNSPLGLDPFQTVYIAFPDASPHMYISRGQSGGSSGASESNSLRKVLLQGIPKALSKSRQRYTLKPTNLSTRSLPELLDRRGPGRTNSVGGGWSVYADTRKTESPLDTVTQGPTQPHSEDAQGSGPSKPIHTRTRRKQVSEARFGPSADINDGKGVERVDIHLEDPPTCKKDTDESWNPDVRLVLQGPHVFAGIRQLVEAGVVDGERMPGWMTGEAGITLGIVRDGRIRGHGDKAT